MKKEMRAVRVGAGRGKEERKWICQRKRRQRNEDKKEPPGHKE